MKRQIGWFSQFEVTSTWQALVLGALFLTSLLAPARVLAGGPRFYVSGAVKVIYSSPDCTLVDMQREDLPGQTHLFLETSVCSGRVSAHASADVNLGTLKVRAFGQPQSPGGAMGNATADWGDEVVFEGLTQPVFVHLTWQFRGVKEGSIDGNYRVRFGGETTALSLEDTASEWSPRETVAVLRPESPRLSLDVGADVASMNPNEPGEGVLEVWLRGIEFLPPESMQGVTCRAASYPTGWAQQMCGP